MTKWDEFLKAEEEVRRGLTGAGLAKSIHKPPPELVDAKSSCLPPFRDPSEAVFVVEGPHGIGSVPIECGVPLHYGLVTDTFNSIGLTVEQASKQLAAKYDIYIFGVGRPESEIVEFVRQPGAIGFREDVEEWS